jgi:hypothetical protein
VTHAGSFGGFGRPIVQVRNPGSRGYQEECIDTLKRAFQGRGVGEVTNEHLNPIAEAGMGLAFVTHEQARPLAQGKQRIDDSSTYISTRAGDEINHGCLLK